MVHLNPYVHLEGAEEAAGVRASGSATGRRDGARQGAGPPVPPLARKDSRTVASSRPPLLAAHCH